MPLQRWVASHQSRGRAGPAAREHNSHPDLLCELAFGRPKPVSGADSHPVPLRQCFISLDALPMSTCTYRAQVMFEPLTHQLS